MQRNEWGTALHCRCHGPSFTVYYDKNKGPFIDFQWGYQGNSIWGGGKKKEREQLRREVELSPEFRQHATNLLSTFKTVLE